MQYFKKYSLIILPIICVLTLIACGSEWKKAIVNEDIEKIKQLIQQGQDVDELCVFEGGQTKLTALFYSENLEICKLLIENGADVNYELGNHMNFTPLFLVKSLEKTKLLIENGADVNHRDKYGYTPLHIIKNAKIAELLIKNGANVNAGDNYNYTPLMDSYISKEKAKVLIDNGADINEVNEFGCNALSEIFDTYKYLIEKGDKQEAKERLEVIKFLIDNGAVLIEDYKGETPLDIAKSMSNIDREVINILNKARSNKPTFGDKSDTYTGRKLEIVEGWDFYVEGNYIYIEGSVKNTGSVSARYFEVIAEFKDNYGNVIDTDYTNSGLTIKPGNSKKFRIMYPYDSNVKSVSIYIDNISWLD